MDVSPSLTYRDPAAALDWLERAFGFARGMVVEDDGRIAMPSSGTATRA